MSVELTGLRIVAVLAAGGGAGFVNAIAGSGSLLTFPTLVALGVPTLTANISNNVGLVPGSFSAVYGYRRELVGQKQRLRAIVPGVAIGAAAGALLLLALPASYFSYVVPFLVLMAVGLLIAQPRLQRAMAAKRERAGLAVGVDHIGPLLIGATSAAAMYGGYFGAAQGVMYVSILGFLLVDNLQRINAAKNVLSAVVNTVAAVIFVVRGGIDWRISGLIALGAIIGGQVGSVVGRRIPAAVLRKAIIVVGLIAAAKLLRDVFL